MNDIADLMRALDAHDGLVARPVRGPWDRTRAPLAFALALVVLVGIGVFFATRPDPESSGIAVTPTTIEQGQSLPAEDVPHIALIVTTHRDYLVGPELPDGEGGPWVGATPVQEELAGFRRFLAGLAPDRRVAVWNDRRTASERVSAWGSPALASKALDHITPELRSAEVGSITRTVELAIASLRSAPRGYRRLVMMTDGLVGPRTLWPETIKLAKEAGVEVHVLAFTLSVDWELANLETLARETGGSFQRVAFDRIDTIDDVLARLAAVVGRGARGRQ